MRLLDRVKDRFRAQGFYEGLASGAAVLMTYGEDSKREMSPQNLIAACQQAYETNGIVLACIVFRMMMLSEARFKFRSKIDKRLYGTEDLRILETPWPNGTSGDLWARAEQNVSLAGNEFLWKAEDDLLVRLPAREVTIVSEWATASGGGTYKRIVGYDWDPSLATPGRAGRDPRAQFFTPDEVAHWAPYPDPLATWRGMSWLSPLLREINADSSLTNYKTLYMDHGTPVTAVKYPAALKEETVDRIMARIQAKFGGTSNAWKPLVLTGGADPVMGAGLKDLDLRAVQAGGETRICAAAGVPPTLIGLHAETARNYEYQVAMRHFADSLARPLWRSGCAAFQKLVPNMPPAGVELWYDTSDISALQEAETERAQVTQVNAAAMLTYVQAGMTRDSVIKAVVSGDLSLLVPDPNAPTPGVAERETITAAESVPVTGPEHGGSARPAVAGNPPGGGQTLTKPQTAASKTPMPSSFPKAPLGAPNGKAKGT